MGCSADEDYMKSTIEDELVCPSILVSYIKKVWSRLIWQRFSRRPTRTGDQDGLGRSARGANRIYSSLYRCCPCSEIRDIVRFIHNTKLEHILYLLSDHSINVKLTIILELSAYLVATWDHRLAY